ncbi:MAG: LysR family transcriptional regulator [Nitrososphaerales archaeon]|nr:LysR family transcriptional regulator [Nitrososphaerales archaeon]
MKEPKISNFRTLLEVVDTKSFTKAAQNLRTTTVTVMNQMNKLEDYFMVKIFERDFRGVTLTNEGRQVVNVARKILEILNSPSIVASPKTQTRGQVRIAANEVPGEHILPCLISNFKTMNPYIEFSMKILNEFLSLEMLENKRVDLISIQLTREFLRKRIQGLDSLEIARDRLFVISAPSHELSSKESIDIKELIRYPLILGEKSSDLNLMVEDLFGSYGIDPRKLDVKLRLGKSTAIVTGVSQGLGVSVVPGIVAIKAERAGLIKTIHLGASHDEVPIFVIKRREKDNQALDRFWEYISHVTEKFRGNLPCILRLMV